MTSPPYWNKREYHGGGIGLEQDWADYIRHLLAVFCEVHRVLKGTGSFWLNLGDTYQDKGLVGIPWRVALAMVDQQKWVIRNGKSGCRQRIVRSRKWGLAIPVGGSRGRSRPDRLVRRRPDTSRHHALSRIRSRPSRIRASPNSNSPSSSAPDSVRCHSTCSTR